MGSLLLWAFLNVVSGNNQDFMVPGAGLSVEPIAGVMLNDVSGFTRYIAGARISALHRDVADASVVPEFEWFSAWRFQGADKPDPKHYFQFGVGLYEFYQPWAFRAGGGMSVELADGEPAAGFYYRGGIGYYFSRSVGLFAEASGLVVFRTEKNLPILLAGTLHWVF